MTLLEKICEELGVELGEEWLGNDGFRYCILSSGNIGRFEDDTNDGYLTLNVTWADILNGTLKPVWKPKEGDKYYIPSIFNGECYRYEFFIWDGSEFDKWFYENNMVFKTKEEAIEATNRMIELYREDK